MEKFIIMPEADTSGVFDANLTPIPFKKLNLPKDLEEEFKEWIKFYDNDCHKTRHYIFKEKMADQLNERGKELALKFKKLYSTSRVSYIGEDGLGFILEEVILIPR